MAVDLVSRTMMSRRSIVLLDDQLVELEHSYTRDRVRRLNYDRIDSIVWWRSLPVFPMLLVGVVFGLSGTGLYLAIGGLAGLIWGGIFWGIGLIIEARYLIHGKTTVRIDRAGRELRVTGVYPRAKLNDFINRMQADVERVQSDIRERRRPQTPEVPPPPAPPVDPVDTVGPLDPVDTVAPGDTGDPVDPVDPARDP